MEDARLDEHGEVGHLGQRWDVNPQHLHAELPVAVPHGDGEHALVALLVDGQLLVGSWQRRKAVSDSDYSTTSNTNFPCDSMFIAGTVTSVPETPVQSST